MNLRYKKPKITCLMTIQIKRQKDNKLKKNFIYTSTQNDSLS